MTTSQQSRLGDAPEEGIKAPVKAISSGPLALFDIGQDIGGYIVQDQDRIAVNGQVSSVDNGIYIAQQGRDWIRSTDFNDGDDVINGQLLVDANTTAVYAIQVTASPWQSGVDTVDFGLLLSPVGFFWGAIGGTLSNQADLQAELDAKSDVGHQHVEADITDLQSYLLDAPSDGNYYGRLDGAWAVVPGAGTFAPIVHTHVEADITDLQPYLLDAAGSIANDDQFYARINGIWGAFSVASGTVGEIIAWPDTDPPDNFLLCDGSSQNAVTFADLFAVLGYKYGGSGANFNLPDLRGTFIRGTANGSGNDPDRLSRTDRGDGVTGDFVGTKQDQAVGPHAHTDIGQQIGDADGGGPPWGQGYNGSHNTGTSGPGIEGDTRPINIGMNYIIRWTGGGSGLTQPPTIEVQADSITLTTAAQLLNFVNFAVTQPVTDEITIQFGASPEGAFYCPGYTFNFVNTLTWSIVGFNVANTFSAGRRLQFTDGASVYYGTIVSSVFSGGDTTMVMSMEDSEVLTSTITEVCLVTSADSWVPTSADPFSGGRINGIATGVIGSTQYWVICGNGGNLATSTDGGLTWVLQTSGTTENLNDVAYNPDDESFLAVGNAGEYTHSTDGSTWNADSSKYAALPEASGGSLNINSVTYDIGGGGWRTLWTHLASQQASAYSTDDTATWDSTPNIGTEATIAQCKIINRDTTSGFTGTLYALGQDVYTFGVIPDETGSIVVNHSSQEFTTALLEYAEGGQTRTWNGHANGEIFNNVTDVDADTTPLTFGSSAIRAMIRSPVLNRIIAVADDGKIGYLDEAPSWTNPAFTLVANGSNPLANFTDVDWNGVDGLFIAVNDAGQILRSTNGLDNIAPAEFTGFTLISQDPFNGSPITHITSGSIGGQVYWVAAGGTQIFVSTNAGLEWFEITTGATGGAAVTSLAYSAAAEQFLAGFADGDLSYTLNGTDWVGDTTSIPALGLTSGNAIKGIHYFEDTGQWMVVIPSNTGGIDTQYRTSDITSPAWATLDGAVTAITTECELQGAKGGSDDRLFWVDNSTSLQFQNNGSDTTAATYIAITALGFLKTAFHVEAGTIDAAPDMHLGNPAGDVMLVTNAIKYTSAGLFSGQVNGFALSTVAARYVGVADGNEIKTIALADIEAGNNWFTVNNPFTADINAVHYDSSDDMIIAVGSNGEIGRSVDGISTIPAPATAWSLVTSPFGGSSINGLATGVVTGIQYWVAVGDAGKIAVSDDAGATWALITSNVTDNLTCVGYSPTFEQFCAGGDQGEYTYSTTLVSPLTGSWTGSTIIGQFAHGDGSGRFQDISFDPDGVNTWHMIWQRLSTSQAAAFASGDPVTWNTTDGGFFGIVTSKSSYLGTYAIRIAYGEDEDVFGFTSAVDGGSSALIPRVSSLSIVTAFKHKLGTFGAAVDSVGGTASGELIVWEASATERSYHAAMTGAVNQIEWSSGLQRLIAVGINGQIRAMEQSDLETDGAWLNIENPFTADINDVKYNATDGYFVAVAADGSIGRSTDGIS